ncbi:MAG TPA: hypothetical protein VLC09_06520, partial [Polyangiaceae bacterium]|nr:hypothetical protein [Polyangiaceae bacterium]
MRTPLGVRSQAAAAPFAAALPTGALPTAALPTTRLAGWSLALWASTVALSACAGQTPPADAPVATDARPRRLEELLPITDRTVSSFRTRDDLGETGLVVFEYYRPRPGLGEIEIAGRIQRLYLHPDAVEHATGGFLLREPLEPGRTFQ